MRAAAKAFVAAALVVAYARTGSAYTRPRWQIGAEIKQSRWPASGPIPIVVDLDQPNGIVSDSRPMLAIRNMLELRSLYTPLTFSVAQTSSPDTIGFDGTNLVTFKYTPTNQSAVSGYAAVTWFWWGLDNDDKPVVLESDIVFNASVPHSTTGFGGVDIEGLGGHELIHFMSFDHSAVIASTAFPANFTPVPNERNPSLDDLAAMSFLYPFPDTPATTGSLTGTVQKPGGTPVFGAHVVAQRVQDGAPVSDISVTGGQWRIDGLPPGAYQVFVEALDGPSYPSNTLFSGVYASQTADQAIRTTFAGGNQTPAVFQVDAGTETTVGAIEVPASGGSLNLVNLGISATRTPVIGASAINMDPGWSAYLTLSGPGVSQVPDNGISVSGPGVTVSSNNVARGTAQDNPYMIVFVSIQPEALPGARTIFANDGTQIAALTGGLEVSPATYPSLWRNDKLTTASNVATALPFNPAGPDFFFGTGEGVLRAANGSDDDDDFYAPGIPSGFLDPDAPVLTDVSRPLVFYQLDDPSRTMYVNKTPFGRLMITYTP